LQNPFVHKYTTKVDYFSPPGFDVPIYLDLDPDPKFLIVNLRKQSKQTLKRIKAKPNTFDSLYSEPIWHVLGTMPIILRH